MSESYPCCFVQQVSHTCGHVLDGHSTRCPKNHAPTYTSAEVLLLCYRCIAAKIAQLKVILRYNQSMLAAGIQRGIQSERDHWEVEVELVQQELIHLEGVRCPCPGCFWGKRL